MSDALTAQILEILREGQDMTLASLLHDGAPHAVVVSYANDELVLFFGCAPDSLKARNIARDPRVAATITLPYRDWGEIRGLTIQGRASRLTPEEADRASVLFLQKFSEVAQYVTADVGELFLYEVTPERIGVLDYRQGFGHLDHVSVESVRPARTQVLRGQPREA